MLNTIVSNYISVIKNFVTFSGRAGREEYWWFFAANIAISVMLSIVDAVTGIPVLGLLYALVAILPGIAVTIRRLHDTNRPGWWLLVVLVPILGAFALLVLMVLPGTDGKNDFGDRPTFPSPVDGESQA